MPDQKSCQIRATNPSCCVVQAGERGERSFAWNNGAGMDTHLGKPRQGGGRRREDKRPATIHDPDSRKKCGHCQVSWMVQQYPPALPHPPG